jgi:imidazolonepropionase-like amidohydrolase
MDEKAKAFTARDRVAYELAESRAADTFDENVAAGLFAKFVRNGTWQVPTLVELRNSARSNPVNASGTDPRWRYLPASVREKWNKDRDAHGSPAGERLFANEILLTKKMHEAGVQFMAGTDSANTFTLPGFALHEELQLLVEAGFTPMEAIQAATLNPARYLGREKELGTIESGKLADLVLLDANPLVDIKNSQRIRAVVVNGHYLSRADLDSMLSRAEVAAK